MRAPTSTRIPAWEDKTAVARWAIATWASKSEQEARAHRLERRAWSPEQNREDFDEWPKEKREGFARWRKRAFELAEQGRFDLLAQYVAVAHLGDITLEERKLLADILTAKIKRGKGRPKETFPHNLRPATVNLERLIGFAEEIRALLIRHYGRHMLQITARAVDIAGEHVQWYGEAPSTPPRTESDCAPDGSRLTRLAGLSDRHAALRKKVIKALEATTPK
jgi:hypothetical protein